MAFYAGTFEWPPELEFEVAGSSLRRTATIQVVGDRYILKPSQSLSASTSTTSERTLKTQIGDYPSVLRGHIFVVDRVVGLRIDEAWIGTNDPDEEIVAIEATFELLPSLCVHRPDDGTARSEADPLLLPEITPAPNMSLILGSEGRAQMHAATPAKLEDFDPHLAALQDLICFATDGPAERTSLFAITRTGARVTILGRNRFPNFGQIPRQPVEYLLRFGGEYMQDVVTEWWRARSTLRPVTQVLAGLRLQPGWVETDVNLLAACVELFGRVHFPSAVSRRINVADFETIRSALDGLSGLNQSQRDFINFVKSSAGGRPQKLDESVDAIIADLGQTLSHAGISGAHWKPALIDARNGVSHAGGAESLTDPELRATRDATRIALCLDLLKFLKVPSAVLMRAADRLKVRYAGSHRDTPMFLPWGS